MSYVPYKSSDNHWFWRPEHSFRKGKAGDAIDATNTAADTFYPLPVRLTNENTVYVRKRGKYSRYYSQTRFQRLQLLEDEEVEIEFSGNVIDRSWLGYLTDQIATTGTSAPYTHISISTEPLTNPPKTIQLLRITKNDFTGGTQNEIALYTGCIVQSYTENGETNEEITGSWKIHCSSIVVGTNLSTYPVGKTDCFVFHSANLIYTKGATEYNGVLTGFGFEYETDKKLTSGGTSDSPIAPQSPNEVKVELTLTIQIWDKSRLEDTLDSIETAQNKTIRLRTQRAANDYFEIEFSKAFTLLEENPEYESGILVARIVTAHNLKEVGAALTLKEVNYYDGTRY